MKPEAAPCLGFGLGLRKEHYEPLLASPRAIDWLEVLIENYLVPGGKPLHYLDRIRERYPVVMHGVSLSIGGSAPLDRDHLRAVGALARRITPRWISDHLCWTGVNGTNLHDLMPLPYTEASLRHVVARVAQVQDFLGQQILLENVSSYMDYAHSTLSEWEFLAAVAEGADCLILLDVNNVFVSARNHDFDAVTYLNALPAARVRQIHLAGHRDHGDYIVDSHDAAVIDPVWALYRAAIRRFGLVATMIERDDDIPPLAVLEAELAIARRLAADAAAGDKHPARPLRPRDAMSAAPGPDLATLQGELQAHVLDCTQPLPACISDTARLGRARRVAIYTDGYRLRLVEALATDFPALSALLGRDDFATMAETYVTACPSRHYSLRWLGRCLEAFLVRTSPYAEAPLLAQMARFEWALGMAFDAADAPVVVLDDLARVPPASWHELRLVAHPSVSHLRLGRNVPALWRAAQDGEPVVRSAAPGRPLWWRLWRHDLRTYYRSLDALEMSSVRWLSEHTFGDLCERLSAKLSPDEVPDYALRLLRTWISENAVSELRHSFVPGDASPCRAAAAQVA